MWNEPDRAPNDPCHAVDRGLGDPVEFVASIICQLMGPGREGPTQRSSQRTTFRTRSKLRQLDVIAFLTTHCSVRGSGKCPAAIAKLLKRSEQAVRHRFYKLGIS
jgi:hypothetical protein